MEPTDVENYYYEEDEEIENTIHKINKRKKKCNTPLMCNKILPNNKSEKTQPELLLPQS